ncbi:TPA: hypothetical protein ACH3X1_003551 [Trebouxia sp. C0004]
MPSVYTSPQPHCSGLHTYNFGGSTRTGRVGLRSAVKQRKSAFLEQSHISPGLHRSSICRCQASDSNGKPGMLFGLKNPFRGLKFGNQASDEETTQADQESQQQLAAEKAQPIGNGMPWKAWKQHFDAMDHSAQQLSELDVSLGQATAFERYQEAAELKKKLDDLNGTDVVEEVTETYREALDSEDYGTAARLRDEGATGLPGWWVADNKDDPNGHLLRISTGFGRYVGYAYTPQDLAQAEGLPLDEAASMLHQFEEVHQCPIDEVGTPVLELFLKKDATGELQQQGTVLSIPPEMLSQAQAKMIQITDLSSDKAWVDDNGTENGPVINISVTVPVQFPKSSSALTSRPPTAQGLWSGKSTSGSPALDGPILAPFDGSDLADSGPGEVIDLERHPATIVQTGRDQLEVTVHPQSLTQTVNQEWGTEDADDSDSDEDDSSADDSASDEDDSSADDSDNPFKTLQSVSSTTNEDTDTDTEQTLVSSKLYPGQMISASDLSNERARVIALFRQKLSDSGQAVSLSGTCNEHEDGIIEFRVGDVQLASTSGSDEESSREEDGQEVPSWETVVNNVLQVVQQLKHFAPKPGESKEDQAKHADLMKKLNEAEKALAIKPESTVNPTPKAEIKSTKTQAELVDALRKAHANGQLDGVVPSDADGSTVQEYMHQLAGSVLNQAMPELMQQMGDRNPIMQAASGEGEGSLKTMKYRRLNTEFVRTDPFTGLYLAAFGSHGPEVLQLQREPDAVDDGVEWVTGTKLTGDSNVPAGEVSFKAKIGRGSRLGTPDMYPPEMGVIARYRGSGCVAQSGFQQPSWVDGELLHFSGDGATTRGAELGFVWTGNQNHFLVILKRIDLSDEEDDE